MMPTNLVELVEYLDAHPFVVTVGAHEATPAGTRMTFLAVKDGAMWFSTFPGGEMVTLPVSCGARSETGLAFDDRGFELTKFGVTLRYDYADGG